MQFKTSDLERLRRAACAPMDQETAAPNSIPLRPTLGFINDSLVADLVDLGPGLLSCLHNEQPGRDTYPLSLSRGEFFSEGVGRDNPQAGEYFSWIADTLRLLVHGGDAAGVLSFEDIDSVGRDIQRRDVAFARARIGRPIDALHSCHGIDPGHPYRKMTLCRTTLDVRLGDRIVPFFYEKFLVSYSYWDQGHRRTTITPIHSHPLNHEVVYFASSGPSSRVVEVEYQVCDRAGAPLVLSSGRVNPGLLDRQGRLCFDRITVRRLGETELRGTSEPVILDPFGADAALCTADVIEYTDGFFRPHQVSVYERDGEETLYYAVNNYFGPLGRVFVYADDGNISTWSYAQWAGETPAGR